MEFKIAVQLLFLHLSFHLATPLKCIGCSAAENSTCLMGTSENSYTCPADQPACYEEYIQYSGEPPLFRRYCGLTDRCITSAHRTVHGEALKYCRTCKEDNCNNKAMSLDCIGCSGSLNSTCQMGTSQNSYRCPLDQPACYEEYIQYAGEEPLYRRYCGLPDRCVTSAHRTVHGEALKYCRTCKEDKCNNKSIKLPIPLDCIGCSGSVNSTCQMGTSQNSYRCPPDQTACYEEYIQYNGQEPLYRRYCGLPDRCVTSAHRTVHGEALKYCRTCKEDKCNNKAIVHECLYCRGGPHSDCETGKVETTKSCPPGKNECYEETILQKDNSPLYRRGCSLPDWCTTERKNHGYALNHCRTCEEKKCNNKVIESPEAKEKERLRRLRITAAAAAAGRG